MKDIYDLNEQYEYFLKYNNITTEGMDSKSKMILKTTFMAACHIVISLFEREYDSEEERKEKLVEMRRQVKQHFFNLGVNNN